MNVNKYILLLLFVFCFGLAEVNNEQQLAGLRLSLAKIQAQIDGAKIVLDGTQDTHDKAISSGNNQSINDAKVGLESARGYYNLLLLEASRIQKAIDTIRNSETQGTKDTISVDVSENIKVAITLLPGWNSFSIPINKTISSSSPLLGDHSVIWGFDGATQNWVKNPKTLYPGRGYFLKILEGGYRIDIEGVSFSTNLSSMVKEDDRWYFVGASEPLKTIDYSKYRILKYNLDSAIENPSELNSGDAFWVHR